MRNQNDPAAFLRREHVVCTTFLARMPQNFSPPNWARHDIISHKGSFQVYLLQTNREIKQFGGGELKKNNRHCHSAEV